MIVDRLSLAFTQAVTLAEQAGQSVRVIVPLGKHYGIFSTAQTLFGGLCSDEGAHRKMFARIMGVTFEFQVQKSALFDRRAEREGA